MVGARRRGLPPDFLDATSVSVDQLVSGAAALASYEGGNRGADAAASSDAGGGGDESGIASVSGMEVETGNNERVRGGRARAVLDVTQPQRQIPLRPAPSRQQPRLQQDQQPQAQRWTQTEPGPLRGVADSSERDQQHRAEQQSSELPTQNHSQNSHSSNIQGNS